MVEKHEPLGSTISWFVGFQLTNSQQINAEQLTHSKATEGILFAAMNDETDGLRVVIRVAADESSSAVGKAIENLWTILETEKINESIKQVLLNIGDSAVDCSAIYHELDGLRDSFHDPRF